jgi:hypothetical protein
MADDEKVEVLANTEIEKLTRLTKYYRLQNMILGTVFDVSIFLIGSRLFIIDLGFHAPACTNFWCTYFDWSKIFQVLANTEIEKLTRLTKYYRLQNMILGTNMT